MSLSFEILCVTMHQSDFSKIKSMNIHSDVVFANQADGSSFQEMVFDRHSALMITTKTRGVGLNRNVALLAASKDIVLFADDDTIFRDDLEENVLKAFEFFPQADVICFGAECSKKGRIYYSHIPKKGRLPFRKSMKYGTYAIAARRNSLLKSNIMFTQLFGGGCLYSHGEDSDFILQCYRKNLNVYSYDYILGCTIKDVSTCNFGYNEKYFYDTGALAKHSFGFLALPYILYMAMRINKGCDLGIVRKIRWMKAGYKGFKELLSYEEYIKQEL